MGLASHCKELTPGFHLRLKRHMDSTIFFEVLLYSAFLLFFLLFSDARHVKRFVSSSTLPFLPAYLETYSQHCIHFIPQMQVTKRTMKQNDIYEAKNDLCKIFFKHQIVLIIAYPVNTEGHFYRYFRLSQQQAAYRVPQGLSGICSKRAVQ